MGQYMGGPRSIDPYYSMVYRSRRVQPSSMMLSLNNYKQTPDNEELLLKLSIRLTFYPAHCVFAAKVELLL